MNARILRITLVCGCICTPFFSLVAQEVEAMYVERNQAVVQVNESELFPAGLLLEDWSNFAFGAGMEVVSGSLSDLFLNGPGATGSWPIPHEWEWDYSFYTEFADAGAMELAFPPGTYTISGIGSGVGAFSQSLSIPSYEPIAPMLVTNFSDLQGFDPNSDLTITWQPFTEAASAVAGFIEVYVYFWNGFYYEDVWDSSGLYEEGDFGLKPDVTSVSVPAWAFQNNSATDYQADLFFIRIDSMDSPNAFPEALLGNITTLDVLFTMIPEGVAEHTVLQPGVWQFVDRIGPIYGYNHHWGYSPNQGILYVAWGPDWIYQANIGWLCPFPPAPGKGKWLFSLSEGWIWIPIPPGDGWYVREDGSTGNMKRP